MGHLASQTTSTVLPTRDHGIQGIQGIQGIGFRSCRGHDTDTFYTAYPPHPLTRLHHHQPDMDGFLAPAHRSSLQPTPTWMAEIANGNHVPLVSHRQTAPAQNWVRRLIFFAKHVDGRRCLLGCLALPIHSLPQNILPA